MIKQIREYIRASIACVDPQMKMDKQPLTESTIASTQIESTYNIRFGTMTLDRDDTTVTSINRLDITIYKKLGTNPTDNFDNAFLKAMEIYATISDQTRIDQDDYIKAISTVELTPNNIESDDNTAVFLMGFNIECCFALGINN